MDSPLLRSRSAIMWLVTIGLIMAGTAVLFYALEPQHASNAYWLAMADILVMEFIAGWTGISSLSALKGKGGTDPTPIAMRISIGTSLILFLVGGAVLSLIFAVISGQTDKLDMTFNILLVVKWLGLLVVIVAMRTAGREGAETRAEREVARKTRSSCVNALQRCVGDLKSMQLPASASASKRQVADHLEATCNQVRGWISATPENGETGGKVESLSSALDQKVSALRSATADQHEALMSQIEQLSRDISFEVKNTGKQTVC